MLLDALYNNASFKGQPVTLCTAVFPNGEKNEPVDLATATKNLQNQITVSQEEILNSVNDANSVIRNAADGDENLYEQRKITLRSESERVEALKIKTDAIKAYAKSLYAQAANLLPGDSNYRYFCTHCMKNKVPLDSVSDLYNQRLSSLIKKAETGVYKNLEERRPVPPNVNEPDYANKKRDYDEKLRGYNKLRDEKEQLMQAHVDMFKKLQRSDVNRIMNHNYTDRELADEFEVINETAAITGQIQNARNATEKWFGEGKGIDSNLEIKDILKVYEPMTSTYTYYKQRLGALVSPTYEYIDPIKNSFSLQALSNANEEDALTGEAAKDATLIQEHKDAINTSIIEDVFKLAGMPYNDLYFVTDDQEINAQNRKRLNVSNYAEAKNKFLTVYDSNNPDIAMKFYPKDLPKVLKGLTEGKSLEELFPIPTPQQAPKPVGWFGRLTDWFSERFFGTTPNKDAYDAALKEYNNRTASGQQALDFKQRAELKKANDIERENAERQRQNQKDDPLVEVNLNQAGPEQQVEQNNPELPQNNKSQMEQNNPEVPEDENIIENENPDLQEKKEVKEEKQVEEDEFKIDINEINDLYAKVNEATGLKITTESDVEKSFESQHQRFSASLSNARAQKNYKSIEKSVAGILLLGKLNKKLEDSVVNGDFNEVYNELNNTLNAEKLDKQAEELAKQPGFSEFVKNMDSDLLNKLNDPERALQVGAYQFGKFAMERKAIEDAKKENEALKQRQTENKGLNKDNGPVLENEEVKHLGNDSAINLGK